MPSLSRESFDYETLDRGVREDIHNAFAASTLRHISAAPEWFSAALYAPEANESQLLETVRLGPVPSSLVEIDDLAKGAGSKFDFYEIIKDEAGKQSWYFDMCRENYLEDGQNLFVVSPHDNIADIAFEQVVWEHMIGYDDNDWQEENGLAISRGITTVNALGEVATELLRKLGPVFLSFQRTETMKAVEEKYRKIAEEQGKEPIDFELLMKTNNRTLRGEVKEWMGMTAVGALQRHFGNRKGRTYHQAWTGKTGVVKRDEHGKPVALVFGEVADGVLDLVGHGHVVPNVTLYDEKPLIKYAEPTKVRSKKDVLRVQGWQARVMADHLELPDSAITLEMAA